MFSHFVHSLQAEASFKSQDIPRNLHTTNKQTFSPPTSLRHSASLNAQHQSNLHQHQQKQPVIHEMFRVNPFLRILLYILTIYKLAIIYRRTTTALSKHQALGCLLRHIRQVWKCGVYWTIHLKTCFPLSCWSRPTPAPQYLSLSNLPHLIPPVSPREKVITAYSTVIFIREARRKELALPRRDTTIIGAGKTSRGY